MARSQKARAKDFVWEETKHVHHLGAQREEDADRDDLVRAMDELMNTSSIPVPALYLIGRIVVLAWKIGYKSR